MKNTVPTVRLRDLNDRQPSPSGEHVLYWMIAARRRHHSFGLQHARDLARAYGKPLIVLEALRLDYPHASARLHAFVVQGMADNHRAFARSCATYVPYVEPDKHAGRGLIEALAQSACAVVTDDYPTFFLRPMLEATGPRLPVPLIAVDGNGLLPLRRATRAFPTARGYRSHLHRHAAESLAHRPEVDPLAGARLPELAELPAALRTTYRPATAAELAAPLALVQKLGVDPAVAPVDYEGGHRAARAQLDRFLAQRLSSYDEARNHPDEDAGSGLSPWLHFGHIAADEVLQAILEHEDVSDPIERIDPKNAGEREQLLGLSRGAEAFLEQLLVWRELAYNTCAFTDDCRTFKSLPRWAQATLKSHGKDKRPHLYTIEQLDEAETYDPLWNAAQRQLRREGRIHNYLRMLWGKKVLEWSPTPETALKRLIWLNDRYAVDGRDPNSYAGITWIFGRYDRAWGPERPIFGTIRYMTSDSAARKLRLKRYLARYAK
jgi:deoxyribodipyrimidine photo-lyase